MAAAEVERSDGIECVAIVAPNHVHYPAARAFLERGIAVLCEKPMCLNVEEAEILGAMARRSNAVFGLAHTYSGYAMVRHARQLVGQGQLGKVRVVQVEYAQDWLATDLEQTGHKQATWRTDPQRSGQGGSIADIGTHAFHLAEFVTGLHCEEIASELTSFVAGRKVDDDARMLLRFAGGARGSLWCSQVATGSGNALSLRVFGEVGALEWAQEEPNTLRFGSLSGATQVLRRGAGDIAAGVAGLPVGHPEGYVDAFAQLYADFADRISDPANAEILLPGAIEGIRGMRFVAAAVASNAAGGRWVAIDR